MERISFRHFIKTVGMHVFAANYILFPTCSIARRVYGDEMERSSLMHKINEKSLILCACSDFSRVFSHLVVWFECCSSFSIVSNLDSVLFKL
ncbi:hypothetical protein L1887_38753 [Cichorium endivia]|nr:hypothetical protein L1887_38753 [Cichorium endivia]